MGWDAFSSAEKDWDNRKLKDPIMDKSFAAADRFVAYKTGSADMLLRMAGLDCSPCATMLEKATGLDAWDEKGWDVETVKEANKNADWDFDYTEEFAWAYWSAKKFLECCAENNLSITFSW